MEQVGLKLHDLATGRRAIGAQELEHISFSNMQVVTPGNITAATEEFSFPPPTAAILTEGSIFLSGGTTLKGFGKAAGIPAGLGLVVLNLNTARYGFMELWNKHRV